MRKCVRCEVVFHSDTRLYCLYCDSRLMDASIDEIFRLKEESVKEKILLSRGLPEDQRLQFLVGTFFKTKTFPFLYGLHRHQFKMDRGFKRFFIQPMDFSFLIRIPWVVIDIVDSLFLRVLYTGFCPECGWKYRKISSQGDHSQDECNYNKEYSAVLNDILTGGIIKTERNFEEQAAKKKQQGQRSAYYDLCTQKRGIESFGDIIVILLSIAFLIYIIVKLTMPIFGVIYDF